MPCGRGAPPAAVTGCIRGRSRCPLDDGRGNLPEAPAHPVTILTSVPSEQEPTQETPQGATIPVPKHDHVLEFYRRGCSYCCCSGPLPSASSEGGGFGAPAAAEPVRVRFSHITDHTIAQLSLEPGIGSVPALSIAAQEAA